MQPSISFKDAPATVGTILRLRAFRKRKALQWSLAQKWIQQMYALEDNNTP